jgi:hypothetical protein
MQRWPVDDHCLSVCVFQGHLTALKGVAETAGVPVSWSALTLAACLCKGVCKGVTCELHPAGTCYMMTSHDGDRLVWNSAFRHAYGVCSTRCEVTPAHTSRPASAVCFAPCLPYGRHRPLSCLAACTRWVWLMTHQHSECLWLPMTACQTVCDHAGSSR